MAVSVTIYSNVNASSKSYTLDFVGDVLAANDEIIGINTASNEYYFKVTTGARQDDNAVFPVKIVRGLDELVLNGQKQRANDTANAYSDIKSMVVDYVYDYIYGHAADLYSSGVSEQSPMKFT